MIKTYTIDHVACWYDAPAAADRGVDEYYSVSLCDADGDEITCVGGRTSLARAWAIACKLADDCGVPAIEMVDESGRETDRYTPDNRLRRRGTTRASGLAFTYGPTGL